MPVGTAEPTREQMKSPQLGVEINGQDPLTDTEELFPDGPQIPQKKKGTLVVPDEDEQALTDSESIHASDEDGLFDDDRQHPTLEEIGILGEPRNLLVTQTDGYARHPSPLLSDNESDVEGIQTRHKKNVSKVTEDFLLNAEPEEKQVLTDVEDMDGSSDEIYGKKVESVMPAYYMDGEKSVSSHEAVKSVSPIPRNNKKTKNILVVSANEDGTTDVEEIAAPKRNKRKIKKNARKSDALTAPKGDSDANTDVEYVGDRHSSDDSDSGLDEFAYGLDTPNIVVGEATDIEDVDASDNEEYFISKSVVKDHAPTIPEPYLEKIRINETGSDTGQVSGNDSISEIVEREALILEDPVEQELTDCEDLDVEEKEELEIINDINKRIVGDCGESVLKEMATSIGNEQSSDKLENINRRKHESGLAINAESDNPITDVEDIDEQGRVIRKYKNSRNRRNDSTSTDSDNASFSEEEIPEVKRNIHKKRNAKVNKNTKKRLPIVSQMSEVKGVQTRHGPLSIVITSDTNDGPKFQEITSGLSNLGICESEDAITDIEIIGDEDTKEDSILLIKNEYDGPETDIEDMEIDISDIQRPLTPLPPEIEFAFLPSPRREKIYIKEDKFGVPQVQVEKMNDNEFLDMDKHIETVLTDTEDLEVSDGEAAEIENSIDNSETVFDYQAMGIDSSEIELKMKEKKKSRKSLGVHHREEGGGTDVEEVPAYDKRPRQKKKQDHLNAQFDNQDAKTDVEILSDPDETKIQIGASDDPLTDLEDFDQSGPDEPKVDDPKCVDTPEIIRKQAIKKTIFYKETKDGVTQHESTEPAPIKFESNLKVDDEYNGITDTEDMVASGTEDNEITTTHNEIYLPDSCDTNVTVTEKSKLKKSANEDKFIKDNLLQPEVNMEAHTDVESLDGEGNRCASNNFYEGNNTLICNKTSSVDSVFDIDANDEYASTFVTKSNFDLFVKHGKDCGIELECDPYCQDLTKPKTVEATLEQIYLDYPLDSPSASEVQELTDDGYIIRRRNIVAASIENREIRRIQRNRKFLNLNKSDSNLSKRDKKVSNFPQFRISNTLSISDSLYNSSPNLVKCSLGLNATSLDSLNDVYSIRDSDDSMSLKETDPLTIIEKYFEQTVDNVLEETVLHSETIFESKESLSKENSLIELVDDYNVNDDEVLISISDKEYKSLPEKSCSSYSNEETYTQSSETDKNWHSVPTSSDLRLSDVQDVSIYEIDSDTSTSLSKSETQEMSKKIKFSRKRKLHILTEENFQKPLKFSHSVSELSDGILGRNSPSSPVVIQTENEFVKFGLPHDGNVKEVINDSDKEFVSCSSENYATDEIIESDSSISYSRNQYYDAIESEKTLSFSGHGDLSTNKNDSMINLADISCLIGENSIESLQKSKSRESNYPSTIVESSEGHLDVDASLHTDITYSLSGDGNLNHPSTNQAYLDNSSSGETAPMCSSDSPGHTHISSLKSDSDITDDREIEITTRVIRIANHDEEKFKETENPLEDSGLHTSYEIDSIDESVEPVNPNEISHKISKKRSCTFNPSLYCKSKKFKDVSVTDISVDGGEGFYDQDGNEHDSFNKDLIVKARPAYVIESPTCAAIDNTIRSFDDTKSPENNIFTKLIKARYDSLERCRDRSSKHGMVRNLIHRWEGLLEDDDCHNINLSNMNDKRCSSKFSSNVIQEETENTRSHVYQIIHQFEKVAEGSSFHFVNPTIDDDYLYPKETCENPVLYFPTDLQMNRIVDNKLYQSHITHKSNESLQEHIRLCQQIEDEPKPMLCSNQPSRRRSSVCSMEVTVVKTALQLKTVLSEDSSEDIPTSPMRVPENEGTHDANLSEQPSDSNVPESTTKDQADVKSQLSQADLAVIESMVVAQEAELEEISFKQKEVEAKTQAQIMTQLPSNDIPKTLSNLSIPNESLSVKPKDPQQLNISKPSTPSKIKDINDMGDIRKIVADVASSMASTLESITAIAENLETSHTSSDEGEEQLMLMRDSPRWEDEEIQAEDQDEPRPIKAEIKLLVKTTEVGKESIEIRSITEFVDSSKEESKSKDTKPEIVQNLEIQQPKPLGSAGPKFVRKETNQSYEKTGDDFNLLAEVRGSNEGQKKKKDKKKN